MPLSKMAVILATVAAVCFPLHADVLVWKSGVRIEVAESLPAIKSMVGVNLRVTLLDVQARQASVLIRRNDIDWPKSQLATEAKAAFGSSMSTVSPAASAASRLMNLPREARVPGVVVYGLEGHSLYGHGIINGTVRNNTDKRVTGIKVKVYTLDYKKRPKNSGWGKLKPKLDYLAPGETARFEAMLFSVSVVDVRHYKAEVFYDGKPPASAPATSVQSK